MNLTPRQQEVLTLIADELTTEQIAQQLGIAIPTVETHRHNLFKKLGVKSVVGLMKEALKQGWVEA